ncbi:MAG: hypothetical protein ACK5YR_07310 [Pirellula sp.]
MKRSRPEDRVPSSDPLTCYSQSETVSDIELSYHIRRQYSAGTTFQVLDCVDGCPTGYKEQASKGKKMLGQKNG